MSGSCKCADFTLNVWKSHLHMSEMMKEDAKTSVLQAIIKIIILKTTIIKILLLIIIIITITVIIIIII